jgi:GDP-L-fucose synthase
MNEGTRIFVAGHAGLVGSAICRRLARGGFTNVLTRTHAELDLTRQNAVDEFFRSERPQVVFLAAARVGGIRANSTYPADFIRDNLLIQTHVIEAAHRNGVERFVFLGSSCVYPRLAPQPISEDDLLSGALEPTNEWYAIAKIAGIKMCQAYAHQYGFDAVALMPSNLYGPNDNFDLENSHVLPALIRKYHEAKLGLRPEVVLWGSGRPRREFLHVDDLADAAVFIAGLRTKHDLLNVGVGTDVTIAELAAMIRDIVGYEGPERFDPTQPDGTPQKLLDTSRVAALGWTAQIGLESGLRQTYDWFVRHYERERAARGGGTHNG